jgi:hypothetical protein
LVSKAWMWTNETKQTLADHLFHYLFSLKKFSIFFFLIHFPGFSLSLSLTTLPPPLIFFVAQISFPLCLSSMLRETERETNHRSLFGFWICRELMIFVGNNFGGLWPRSICCVPHRCLSVRRWGRSFLALTSTFDKFDYKDKFSNFLSLWFQNSRKPKISLKKLMLGTGEGTPR